jgi:nitrite reductase/ring-hydroxylating ferredoxin subunit
MAWISLCATDELTEGQGKCVSIDGFDLAVFCHEGNFYAMDNVCPHQGHDLSGGPIVDGCVICPWHGWQFRLTDGVMPNTLNPAVRVYKTRLYERADQPPLVQADLPMV